MPAIDDITLEKELREIIAKVVEITPEEIGVESNFVEDLGMDSMMALEILAAIEKKYKVVIPEDMLPKFITLNQTISLVRGILEKKK